MSHNGENETPDEEIVDVDQVDQERDKLITNILKHEEVLIENSGALDNAFESFFDPEYVFNDLGKLWGNINVVIRSEFDDLDDLADAANALLNLSKNLDGETIVQLREEGADEDLISLLKEFNLDYGHQLDRQFNRLEKGRNWWSNIKTNTGFRSNRPTFEHEITIDYEHTVVFNSNINSTFLLIEHFVRQLESVPKLVGDDALLEMEKDQIDTIVGRLESLKEDIKDYENELDDISEDFEESESNDESDVESEDQLE